MALLGSSPSQLSDAQRASTSDCLALAVSLQGGKNPLGHLIDLAEAVDLYQQAA